jgi:hypothetical protein
MNKKELIKEIDKNLSRVCEIKLKQIYEIHKEQMFKDNRFHLILSFFVTIAFCFITSSFYPLLGNINAFFFVMAFREDFFVSEIIQSKRRRQTSSKKHYDFFMEDLIKEKKEIKKDEINNESVSVDFCIFSLFFGTIFSNTIFFLLPTLLFEFILKRAGFEAETISIILNSSAVETLTLISFLFLSFIFSLFALYKNKKFKQKYVLKENEETEAIREKLRSEELLFKMKETYKGDEVRKLLILKEEVRPLKYVYLDSLIDSKIEDELKKENIDSIDSYIVKNLQEETQIENF